jgi:hypothetical protein
MDLQSAEISPVTFVRRESVAISVAMESSLAADAAPLTSDNGSERRAFSIGEVQKNDLSEMPTYFSSRIYCIKCGYVPTGQENRRSRNVCNVQPRWLHFHGRNDSSVIAQIIPIIGSAILLCPCPICQNKN